MPLRERDKHIDATDYDDINTLKHNYETHVAFMDMDWRETTFRISIIFGKTFLVAGHLSEGLLQLLGDPLQLLLLRYKLVLQPVNLVDSVGDWWVLKAGKLGRGIQELDRRVSVTMPKYALWRLLQHISSCFVATDYDLQDAGAPQRTPITILAFHSDGPILFLCNGLIFKKQILVAQFLWYESELSWRRNVCGSAKDLKPNPKFKQLGIFVFLKRKDCHVQCQLSHLFLELLHRPLGKFSTSLSLL